MLYPNSGSHSCFCLILDKVICPEDCRGPLCAVVFLETVSGLCLAAGSLSPAEGSAFRGSIVSFSGGGFFFFSFTYKAGLALGCSPTSWRFGNKAPYV